MSISISMRLLRFKQKAVSFDVGILVTRRGIPLAFALAVSTSKQHPKGKLNKCVLHFFHCTLDCSGHECT